MGCCLLGHRPAIARENQSMHLEMAKPVITICFPQIIRVHWVVCSSCKPPPQSPFAPDRIEHTENHHIIPFYSQVVILLQHLPHCSLAKKFLTGNSTWPPLPLERRLERAGIPLYNDEGTSVTGVGEHGVLEWERGVWIVEFWSFHIFS